MKDRHLDAMQTLNTNLFHFRCDCVLAISRQTVHAGPKNKVCADCLSSTEEFIDIALSISDMNTARRLLNQCCRLPYVLQPAVALLMLDRYAGRINALFQMIAAIKLIPAPELDRRQTQRKTIECNSQTGVHQNPAYIMMLWLSVQFPLRYSDLCPNLKTGLIVS